MSPQYKNYQVSIPPIDVEAVDEEDAIEQFLVYQGLGCSDEQMLDILVEELD